MADEQFPRGEFVGVMDEYGSIWSGEPGASEIIGDGVVRPDEETTAIYLRRAPVDGPDDSWIAAPEGAEGEPGYRESWLDRAMARLRS
jgi:hypothetical protein